jgi:hypothetical protein
MLRRALARAFKAGVTRPMDDGRRTEPRPPAFPEVPVRLTRSLLAVFAVGALSLSLTACGGDDSDSLSSISDEAGDTADDAVVDDATDDSGDIDLDDLEDLDDLADMAGVDEICLGGAYLAAGMMGGLTGETDTDATEYFEEYADQVPEEIRDDFGVVAEFWAKYSSILAEYDNDFSKLAMDEDAMAELEALSTPEVEAANENVSAWFDENCDTTN